MYTRIGLALSVVMGCIGIVDVRLRQTEPLVVLSSRSQDRPIMDPDDGVGRSFEQDKPRLDRFAKEMKVNHSTNAIIIAFAGMVSYRNEARIRLNCTGEYLVNIHGIARSRLKLIDGGYREERSVKLFLVKPGSTEVPEFPSMDPQNVRITKAPKYPCGKPVKPRR